MYQITTLDLQGLGSTLPIRQLLDWGGMTSSIFRGSLQTKKEKVE